MFVFNNSQVVYLFELWDVIMSFSFIKPALMQPLLREVK